MESFEARVELACSLAEVFDLVSRPTGIQQISPPDMGLSFMESPEQYALGAKVQFRVHAMGLVKEITHEITAFDRPTHFSERQIAGPFQYWEHEHLFELHESGGVIVIDRIQFEPPGGLAGLVMNAKRIRDNLDEGFDYRHEQLEKLFDAL